MAVNRYYSSTAIDTTLSAPITDSATSITVVSVAGFPATRPYTLSIDAENASKELVTVTNAAGTTLTVTRGVDGTSGVAHTLGAVVRHDHSARDFREPQEHIAATSDVHGITGSLADLASNTSVASAVAAAVTAHTSDAVDAHAASAIGFTPVGTIAATNAQSAIAEVASEGATATALVQTNLDAHLADSVDAHDASAISFSPTGALAATDVQSAIAEVVSDAAPTAWTAVTFTNGWANFGSGLQDAQYRKVGDIVYLRGAITNPGGLGTIGSSAFTLPAGFRPPASQGFAVDSNGGHGRVSVASAGTVIPDIGHSASVRLDGIDFSVTA